MKNLLLLVLFGVVVYLLYERSKLEHEMFLLRMELRSIQSELEKVRSEGKMSYKGNLPATPPDSTRRDAPSLREGAIQSAEKERASLQFRLRRLELEISHYGSKIGANSLRAPASLSNEKAKLEYNLALLLVELQGLRDPDVEYPLPQLSSMGNGDFFVIPGWRK